MYTNYTSHLDYYAKIEKKFKYVLVRSKSIGVSPYGNKK